MNQRWYYVLAAVATVALVGFLLWKFPDATPPRGSEKSTLNAGGNSQANPGTTNAGKSQGS